MGPAAPEVLWEGSLHASFSQQALADGELVVVTRVRSFDVLTGTWIVAHERATGAIRWQAQVPARFPDSWRCRADGFRDGVVYVTRSGNANAEHLYALDARGGGIRWRSRDLVIEGSTESLAFAPDGDPITTGRDAAGTPTLLRIEATDGTTVWSTPRTCPTTGGCDAAIGAERAYVWESSPEGPVITAFELATGARMHSSRPIGGGFVQQVAPFVGPDGTVYAPRSQNDPSTDFLVALEDRGDAFVERWRHPIGFVPFASHAIGPDGTVYAIDRESRLVGLDPATGAVRARTHPLPHDFPLSARMAVDATGNVFLTNGGAATGAVFAFGGWLEPLWQAHVRDVGLGGPAITDDGILVVCGSGVLVRAYRSRSGGR